MFQYNPTVNDRSAEILANASTNAAQIQAQGMQNFGQSIGQSIGNAMESLGEGVQKRREDLAKVETSMAAGEAMMNLSQQFGPDGELFRQSYSEALAKAGKNADKIAGATAAHAPFFDSLMSMKQEQARMDGYKDLADYKSSLGGSSTDTAATPKYDFNYATQFNKALYDSGITNPEQRKQKFNEAGIGHLYEKFINPPKQNMGFFGPVTE